MFNEFGQKKEWVWSDNDLKKRWDSLQFELFDADYEKVDRFMNENVDFCNELKRDLEQLKKIDPGNYPANRKITDYEFYHIISGSTIRSDDPPPVPDFHDQRIRNFINQMLATYLSTDAHQDTIEP